MTTARVPAIALLALALMACGVSPRGQVQTSASSTGSPSSASDDPTGIRLTPAPVPTALAPLPSATSGRPIGSPRAIGGARRADAVRERWEQFLAGQPDGTIVFTTDLADGGGWRGREANDQKVAALSGLFEATVPLSTETPPPSVVRWADRPEQAVELISGAEALGAMIREFRAGGSSCAECRQLQVVGARLVTVDTMTARGPASVPAWQFEFAPRDEPLEPMTFVAVRDAVTPTEFEPEPEYGGDIGAAYGRPGDTTVTVGVIGSACTKGYAGEAVESDSAIVGLITSLDPPRAAGASPQACIALGVYYPVELALSAPLGDRMVLDLATGYPVPLLAEDPPPQTR